MCHISNGENFGIVYKRVMIDEKLSIESKAIYAYLCTFAGNKNIAYPSESLICCHLRIGRNRFYKYLKELKDAGYIIIHKHKDKNNQFQNNVYEIVGEPCTQFEDMEIEDLENRYTNNNSINTNNLNTNNSLHPLEKGDHLHPLKKDGLHPSPKDAPILFNLYESDDPFVREYLKVMTRYGLKHKRMSRDNYHLVLAGVHVLQENHTVNDFSEVVQEHFDNLPKTNDGDIIPFLGASMRYFNERLEGFN
jgi:hypothetical protein